MDQTIINEDLCKWLAEELELTQLASKLRQVMEREAGAEEILYPVFKEINYLTYEELKALNGRLTELNKESTAIRKKRNHQGKSRVQKTYACIRNEKERLVCK